MMLERRRFLRLLGLAALLPLASGRKSNARSLQKEIQLIDVYIAGFQYYDGMKEEVLQSLQVDDPVLLKREPENIYDGNAIEVFTSAGHKLGYLPRSDNTVIATIADQDVELGARLAFIDPKAPPWERVALSVYQLIPASNTV
jgi:hypothetical protein